MNDQRLHLPIDSDTEALVNRLLAQLEKKKFRNLMRASYYDSKRAVKKVGSVVPPQYYNLGLTLGWTGKAVDLLARRTNLDSIVWPDGDLADIGGDKLFTENALRTEFNGGAKSSLIHASAFLVNTAGEAGEPDSLIHTKSALDATGDWNSRRRSLDNLISITGRDDKGKTLSFALYLPGKTLIAERESVAHGWSADWSNHAYGMPVEVLAYQPHPRRPFGSSRISRPIMALQDAAVRGLIRLEGHMDVYSYPELWMLGADMSAFKNADGTQKSVWEVRMGRIKGLPDDEDATIPRADVKQIPASDPTPHLADLNALAKMFAREASLPDTAVAITDVSNPTSAESFDASQYELIAEAEGAVDDWSTPLRRSFIRGLAIKNKIAIEDVPDSWKSIQPKFRDPRFLSRAAEADAGMKQIAAVPWLAESAVGLELLGLNEQQIERALADRRRSQGILAVQQITDAAAAARGA